MDPIRVGVIGSGGIFRGLHAPYFEQTKLAKIVAVADVNEKNAQEQAKRFGAEAYTDFRALLERKDVDAVDLCTHPAPHRDITVAAAQAGKHILLEKPMCRTVAEADEMIAAAKKARVQLQVAYMMRFNPNYMKLKEMPWYNQPWSRVENDGVSAMNDAELLAAVLGEGYGADNAVDLSNRVLDHGNGNNDGLRKGGMKEGDDLLIIF